MKADELGLSDVIGEQIVSVRRAFYEYQNELDRSVGPLELKLSDDTFITFDTPSGGESVVIKNTPWRDYFSDPASPDTQEFIEEHGKWTAFDVSKESAYHFLCGSTVTQIRLTRSEDAHVSAVCVETSHGDIYMTISGDELLVSVTARGG